jgi:uncharacterized protein YbjQ (UPF0145 family)
MIVTTLQDVTGYRVAKTLGLARGNTIRARHVGRDFMASLRGVVGGEITDYTKMLAEAREQALDRMVADAAALGANGVLGVRFATSYLMSSAAEILVYGTAVYLEPVEAAAVKDAAVSEGSTR